jgi:hypothetical protein
MLQRIVADNRAGGWRKITAGRADSADSPSGSGS